MNKYDFLRRLEFLLMDITPEERNDALKYYQDYFDDAGIENESKVLKEIGSPEDIAASIKADLNGQIGRQSVEQAPMTMGDMQHADNAQQNTSTGANTDYAAQQQQYNNDARQTTTNKGISVGLLILIGVLAIPVGIPVIATIFGLAIGFFAAIFGLLIGFAAAGVACMIAGVFAVVVGFINIAALPFYACLCIGTGALTFGLGILFLFLVWLLGKFVVPASVRGFVKVCSLPFHRKAVTA